MSNDNILIINSLDRDITQDSSFTYTFSFNSSDSHKDKKGHIYKLYKNIQSIFITHIIIPNIYIDIRAVHGSKQLGYINTINNSSSTFPVSFPRLANLPYLLVNIEQLNGNVSGTQKHNNVSTASFVYSHNINKNALSSNMSTSFFYDSGSSKIKQHVNYNKQNIGEGILLDTNKEHVVFINLSTNPMDIKKELLDNLTISIRKPNGELIKQLNNHLTIKQIGSFKKKITISGNQKYQFSYNQQLRENLFLSQEGFTEEILPHTYIETTSNVGPNFNHELNHPIYTNLTSDIIFESRKIEIICNEYFSSEEYCIGDTLKLFNLIINDNINLRKFLEFEDHTIIGLRRENINSSLYNIIEISPKTTIDIYSGNQSHDFFGLDVMENNESIYKNISGTILNVNNQSIINMIITN